MPKTINIGDKLVGEGQPTFFIAEIGINHNGDISNAKRLIDVAVMAGCNAVKFQKRNPEKAVPAEYKNVIRETPWGLISYLEYRYKVEFGYEEYVEIDRYCKEKDILWLASCWDEDSIEFIEQFEPPCYKVASASLTDHALLDRFKGTKRPIILSTGMSTMEEIEAAVDWLDTERLLIAHSTSTYPCPPAPPVATTLLVPRVNEPPTNLMLPPEPPPPPKDGCSKSAPGWPFPPLFPLALMVPLVVTSAA